MKFTIQRDELERAIARAGSAVGKTTLPVLEHLLLSAGVDHIELTGTNLDLIVRTRAPANIATPGVVCIPAARLQALAPLLPAGPVTIAENKDAIVITAGAHRSRIPTFPADEWPTLPEPTSEPVTVAGDVVRAMALRLVPLCVYEPSRPVFAGIACIEGENGSTFAAGDGTRTFAHLDTDTGLEFKNILPANVVQAAAKLLDLSAPVEVRIDNDRVSFTQDATTITSRMIDGVWVNTAMLFGQSFPNVLTVGAATLALALKRLNIVAITDAEKAPVTVFEMTHGLEALKAAAATPDRGRVTEQLGATYTGAAMRVGVNSRSMLQMIALLEKAGCDTARLSFTDKPEGAILIEGVGSSQPTPRFITAPMRAGAIDLVGDEPIEAVA